MSASRAFGVAIFMFSFGLVAVGLILFALYLDAPVPPESYGIRAFTAVYVVEGAILGILITSSRPANAIGWIVASVGATFGILFAAQGYALSAALPRDGIALPGVEWAAWLVNWVYLPATTLTVLMLLLFPDGHFTSRSWRTLAWLMIVMAVLGSLALAVIPGPFAESPSLANPIGLDVDRAILQAFFGASILVLIGGTVAAAWSVGQRWRRADGDERQQIKWLALAGAVLAVSAIAVLFGDWGEVAFQVGLALVYLAVGIAVLRYRLYEVDAVISRTFVYGTMTAILAGLYTASIRFFNALFTGLTGESSDEVLVITTLILATTFTPLRGRLERLAERIFGGASAPSAPPSTPEELDHMVRRVVREELATERGVTSPR